MRALAAGLQGTYPPNLSPTTTTTTIFKYIKIVVEEEWG
jgi:hypothetical protein